MAQLFESHVPSLAVTILTALGSGSLVALANNAFAFFKEQRAVKREKLEELHSAVFYVTTKLRFTLHIMRDSLKNRASTISQGHDDDSQEVIEHDNFIKRVVGDVPNDLIENNVGSATGLISIYFKELVDERDRFQTATLKALHLIRTYAPGVTYEENDPSVACHELHDNLYEIQRRLTKRIREIGERGPFYWFTSSFPLDLDKPL